MYTFLYREQLFTYAYFTGGTDKVKLCKKIEVKHAVRIQVVGKYQAGPAKRPVIVRAEGKWGLIGLKLGLRTRGRQSFISVRQCRGNNF